MIKKISLSLVFFTILIFSSGICQHIAWNDTIQADLSVTLKVYAEPNEVPLNRTLRFIIQISWKGDIDLVRLGEVEIPKLTNLQSKGNSRKDRVMIFSEGRETIKETVFLFSPETEGMAYIDPVAMTYKDMTTGKIHSLKTKRVCILVIKPVPVEGESSSVWIWIGTGGAAAGFAAAFFLMMFRRKGKKKEEKEEVLVEELFLAELKEKVDLTARDRHQVFVLLSRLFRGYLSEKYNMPALEATTELEATTDKLLVTLNKKDLDERLVRRCESFFNKADKVKFSGQKATRTELDEAYTMVETWLESHLKQAKEELLNLQKKSKKRKREK